MPKIGGKTYTCMTLYVYILHSWNYNHRKFHGVNSIKYNIIIKKTQKNVWIVKPHTIALWILIVVQN